VIAARKHWLPVALLCGWSASLAEAAVLPTDLEARVGADYVPVDADERAIWQGLARLEEGVRDSPQRLMAPELDAHIRSVIERLIGRPAPELRIYVMRDASFNAAMLPSGMMIVNTGLLARVRDESQLAAVLAHEAGHYFRRHSLDLHRDDRRRSAITSSAVAALHSYSETHGGWSRINYAIMMSSFRFSRDLESEADAYGLQLMVRAGYHPRAAVAIWEQVIEERRASATVRQMHYRDATNSPLSTHPPSQGRMTNLADTADYLAGKRGPLGDSDHDEWAAVIQPYQATLLREQIYLNDPGASLYLLENRTKDGWTGLLRFEEGEVYRLRDARDGGLKAASAYAAATALPDAPAEAWRAHGYALLKAGNEPEAHEALNRFLAMDPAAPDAALIRFTLGQKVVARSAEVGGRMILERGSSWERVQANPSETQWDEVWSRSGPQVDRMAVVGGLRDGKRILVQEPAAAQQVPVFRADMTAQDLTSMLEVSYRLNGVTVFNIESVEPVDFLGGPGIKLRYNYASGIVIPKRGGCVMRVVDRKLYAMKLESVAHPDFDRIALEFDRLVAEARLAQ
jgi:beta-barrel assembly-enhancing protease